jgi:phosphoglycolate phosphatase-like HAD superfamily hydrolase
MVDRVVAFDIDGTLTEQKAKDVYRKLYQKSGVTVGIITSNPRARAENFLDENDLQYEFLNANLLKFFPLRGQGLTFTGMKMTYVGNTARDMFAAKLTGWDFVHVSEVDKAL